VEEAMSFSDNPDDQRYHAFLSHNVTDMPLVEKLAENLENRGLSWLLEKWNLISGNRWQSAIEQAIAEDTPCKTIIESDKGEISPKRVDSEFGRRSQWAFSHQHRQTQERLGSRLQGMGSA
jgi:hypothetical protein